MDTFHIVLMGAGVVVCLLLAIRFGRAIGALVATVVIGVAIVAVALSALAQGAATYQTAQAAQQTAKAATAAANGQAVATIVALAVIGLLALALLVALGAASLFWLRWQRAEGNRIRRQSLGEPSISGWLPGPNARWGRWRRRALPRPTYEPVVYVVGEDAADLVPLDDLTDDLAGWGWSEVAR